MNVIVANRQEAALNNLDVEIIKTLKGEFEVDEIVATFSNFFFAKMILDITAIRNFTDITNFQKLSIGIPVDKIILLLPNDPAYSSGMFISKLISMGYYNFTTNIEGVKYLINRPNTYKEVAHLHQLNQVEQQIVQVGGGTTTVIQAPQGKIIGFKNVTEHAGSTTLVYLLKKQLETHYHKEAIAIEVGKHDFAYFNDESLISVSNTELADELIKARNKIVLVDLNSANPDPCDEVYYLIEPSIIKFNKYIKDNIHALSDLTNKKIILNKTLLSPKNVSIFSKETNLKIFSVVAPVDDRRDDLFLADLISILGLDK